MIGWAVLCSKYIKTLLSLETVMSESYAMECLIKKKSQFFIPCQTDTVEKHSV